MKLFKVDIFIRTHGGLGINQNRTVYSVAKDSVVASALVKEKFHDSDITNISAINELVLCSKEP